MECCKRMTETCSTNSCNHISGRARHTFPPVGVDFEHFSYDFRVQQVAHSWVGWLSKFIYKRQKVFFLETFLGQPSFHTKFLLNFGTNINWWHCSAGWVNFSEFEFQIFCTTPFSAVGFKTKHDHVQQHVAVQYKSWSTLISSC